MDRTLFVYEALVFVSLHGPVILPDDVILAFTLRPSRISWKGL